MCLLKGTGVILFSNFLCWKRKGNPTQIRKHNHITREKQRRGKDLRLGRGLLQATSVLVWMSTEWISGHWSVGVCLLQLHQQVSLTNGLPGITVYTLNLRGENAHTQLCDLATWTPSASSNTDEMHLVKMIHLVWLYYCEFCVIWS